MLIVCAEEAQVEAELLGGLLGCPSCREVLGPWGHGRERVLRCRSGDRLLVPRRARCRGCAGTHVLLPEVVLLRRQLKTLGREDELKASGQLEQLMGSFARLDPPIAGVRREVGPLLLARHFIL